MGIILHKVVRFEVDIVHPYLPPCWEPELSVSGCQYYNFELDVIRSHQIREYDWKV